MHRSGTSLLASCIEARGAHLGEHLVGPGRGNPWGHFENQAFVEFHHRAMAQRVSRWDNPLIAEPFVFDPTSDEHEMALGLLPRRSDPTETVWGWKDPRTCLFAPFWLPLLPEATVLLIYRHPLEVADSLWRRATDPILAAAPTRAIRSYELYNDAALQAIAAHPGPCRIVHAVSLFEHEQAFSALLSSLPSLSPLERSGPWPVQPRQFRSLAITAAIHSAFAAAFPEAAAVFDNLQSWAKQAAPAHTWSPAPPDSAADAAVATLGSLGIADRPDAALALLLGLAGSHASTAPAAAALLRDFESLESDLLRAHQIIQSKQAKLDARRKAAR